MSISKKSSHQNVKNILMTFIYITRDRKVNNYLMFYKSKTCKYLNGA